MKKSILIVYGIFLHFTLFSQVEDIYFGAGKSGQITTSASDNHQLYPGLDTASASNTINGKGLIAQKMEASRFLNQSSFGGSIAMIDDVVSMGIENWLDSQFIITPTFYSDSVKSIYTIAHNTYLSNGGMGFYPSRAVSEHMDYAWWQTTMTSEDVLRQRVAYALSEILVISLEGDLSNHGVAVANYYDILVENAFGNFQDILLDVSIHPAMGAYLTHYRNEKTDTAAYKYPDENYAREIMQLFTIGLDSLNIDGSPVLDSIGNRIPTYDNDDIVEFAKVFTGLSAGGVADYVTWTTTPSFGLSFWGAQKDTSMAMYEPYHEQGEKHLLNGYIIPAGQTGMEDVEETIEHLFNHPNVGPFITYRLIQHLIKSNPTPSFITDIATIFNDNGQGERGNLKDVIKAILLHPEARECTWINDPSQGKLKEPILRKTQFLNAIGLNLSPLNNYWGYYSWFYNETSQHPLHSPTVFNFYKPSFAPNGLIEDAGNVAPEFEIYNSRTSIGYARQVYRWIEDDIALRTTWRDGYEKATLKLDDLNELAKDADALLDYLDIILTNGSLSNNTRSIIKNTINGFATDTSGIESRIKLATYLIMISPDFNILK